MKSVCALEGKLTVERWRPASEADVCSFCFFNEVGPSDKQKREHESVVSLKHFARWY